MAAYVLHEHGRRSAYLFPAPRRPGQPAPCVARTLLAGLCRRAGLPRFTPHQFRHYLVNTLMQRGNRLECVARWLGHRTPHVTYRHYWTDQPTALLEGQGRSELDGALFGALEAKVAECDRLRAALRAALAPTPPLPTELLTYHDGRGPGGDSATVGAAGEAGVLQEGHGRLSELPAARAPGVP